MPIASGQQVVPNPYTEAVGRRTPRHEYKSISGDDSKGVQTRGGGAHSVIRRSSPFLDLQGRAKSYGGGTVVTPKHTLPCRVSLRLAYLNEEHVHPAFHKRRVRI